MRPVHDVAVALRVSARLRAGGAATLGRDGFASPGGIAVAGDEDAVAAGSRRCVEAGSTDVNVSLLGTEDERRRTLAVLGHLAGGT